MYNLKNTYLQKDSNSMLMFKEIFLIKQSIFQTTIIKTNVKLAISNQNIYKLQPTWLVTPCCKVWCRRWYLHGWLLIYRGTGWTGGATFNRQPSSVALYSLCVVYLVYLLFVSRCEKLDFNYAFKLSGKYLY